MKDRWKFCQCCYLNGHCENQDRDMKCEHYSKQLEDKVERLQEQLNEANEVIKNYAYPKSELVYNIEEYQAWRTVPTSPEVGIKYLEKWGVK